MFEIGPIENSSSQCWSGQDSVGEILSIREGITEKRFTVKSITPVINTFSPWMPRKITIELEEI